MAKDRKFKQEPDEYQRLDVAHAMPSSRDSLRRQTVGVRMKSKVSERELRQVLRRLRDKGGLVQASRSMSRTAACRSGGQDASGSA